MANFIEKFYYGNIDPQARGVKKNSRVQKEMALLPAEKEERTVGVWGQQHLRYIRQYKKVFYTNLLTSGKLQSYLADVEEQAQELFDRLVKQQAEREGITEKIKVDNQMEWVQKIPTFGFVPKSQL